MKKPNATLEWDACFLKCNGWPVAEVAPSLNGWLARTYDTATGAKEFPTRSEAEHHLNRRFKIKD